jgi:hypothetical protein
MVQRSLGVDRVIVDTHKVEALYVVMVVLMAGLTRITSPIYFLDMCWLRSVRIQHHLLSLLGASDGSAPGHKVPCDPLLVYGWRCVNTLFSGSSLYHRCCKGFYQFFLE